MAQFRPDLERLAQLIGEHRRVAAELDMEIDRLARANVGWPEIAHVLGVSRQAARQRHERRVRSAVRAALGWAAAAHGPEGPEYPPDE